MDGVVLVVLIILAALLAVNAVALYARGRAPAADPAAAAALLNQQLETVRAQMRDTLDAGTAQVNQRLEAVARQMGDVSGRVDQRLDAITRQVGDRLRENYESLQASQKTVGERLEGTAALMGRVENGLGRVEEVNRRVFEVGRDIAGLQEILRAPKLRGNLGELFLGDLLAQVLSPPHFTLQYAFRSGEKVDAVISLGQGLVPVDSKFPLENFIKMIQAPDDPARAAARRTFAADVKKHVDAIATKYILPDEGTFDFALMYIPAENVYYETIIRDDAFGNEKSISDYALARHVIPVSPNSFYAYLMALATGLKGLRIEDSAKEIMNGLDRLRHDFERVDSDFSVLARHVRNAAQTCDRVEKRLAVFHERMLSLGAAPGAAPDPVPGGALDPASGGRAIVPEDHE